ncbi:unnamed protein product [Lymnaea stagnalis]|uniref:Uncharacterized protein n=1 Tax=Lymnaea stagnalis TaxID=6523 RepID=A0AAV2I2W1_LYMST
MAPCPTERGISMRGAAILQLLLSLITLSSVVADTSSLLTHLKDKSFPWFGTNYPTNCPDPATNFHTCFNPGHAKQESILERAGFENVEKLSVELKVKFSAPAEQAAVCGSYDDLSPVEEFELNPTGQPPEDTTKLIAENYRRLPDVSWATKSSTLHTLIFFDVGFYRIRGWFFNISSSNTELKGWTSVPYYPPANPTTNTNPTLILLLEQSETKESQSDEIMHACVETYYNSAAPESCREQIKTILSNGYTLVGAQVFYTTGGTRFEKFRACTESFVCPEECVSTIRAASGTITSKFADLTDMEQDNFKFYVNFRFTGLLNKNIKLKCCPDPQPLAKFEFRPVVGEKPYVENVGHVYPELTGARMWLEIGGTETAFTDAETYYSVGIVDPMGSSSINNPWGHYFISNFKYPDANTGREVLQQYSPPTPPFGNHTYVILLFSHKDKISQVPVGSCGTDPAGGPSGSPCWNLKELPSDFVVIALSWFDAESDEFSQEYASKTSQTDCSENPNAFSCLSGGAPLESNPPIRIAVSHEVLPSADPAVTDKPATEAVTAGTPAAAKPNEATGPATLDASNDTTLAEVTAAPTQKETVKTTKEPVRSIGSSVETRLFSVWVIVLPATLDLLDLF